MANKQHKNLLGEEVHLPKNFDTAANETALVKNFNGELEYRLLSELGETGPTGPQGPDASAIAKLVVVQKSPGPGQFSDPIAAMASIADSSSSNPYVIEIGPGIYSLSAPLVSKEGVTVKVRGHGSVIFEPATPTNDIIQINHIGFRIQGLTLRNATGASAAAVRINGVSSPAVLDFITISNCTEGIVVESVTAIVQAVLRNIRIISGSTTKKLLRIQAAGGFASIVRVYSAILTDDDGTALEEAMLVTGVGSRLDMNTMLVRSTTGVGYGLRCNNGAEIVSQSGSEIEGFDENLFVENTGSAPIVRTTTVMLRAGVTWDLNIEHPGTMGSGIFKADVDTKVFVDDDAPLKLVITDPDITHTTGMFVRGDIIQADKFSQKVNGSKLGRAEATMGRFEGGVLSDGGGLNVDFTEGDGFLIDPVGQYVKEITWAAGTLTVPANSSRYVFVNTNGVVGLSASLPDLAENVLLGRVSTLAANIHFIQRISLDIHQFGNRVSEFHREAFGPIYSSGSIVSENGVLARALDITSGSFWFSTQNFMPSGGMQIMFSQFYIQAGAIYNVITELNQVNNTHYDNGSGILQALGAGKFAKHSLYVVGDGVDEKYFLVTSQAQYDSQVEAEGANIPTPPQSFDDAVALIATIIVQEGQTNLISILDNRPVLGFKASGVSASASHGNLLGLLDDDHPQYLLANGGRSLSGDLNMGGNNISNVGTVDGVDVSDHASRHLPNGADPLTTAAPPSGITDSTNGVGSANSFMRSDAQIAHGNRGGGALHAEATTSVAGFMSAADKLKLDNAVFGQNYQFANFTGNSAATQYPTFNQIHRLTTPSLPAGTYRIAYTLMITRTSATGRGIARVQVDDAINVLARWEDTISNTAAFLVVAGFQDVVLGAGAHNIDVDLSSTGSGQNTIANTGSNVSIFRVA